MSQAIALKEFLEEAGHSVENTWVGSRPVPQIPEYFTKAFPGKLVTFQSPYFLLTPNKKGIYIGRTLLYNLLRIPRYLAEARSIRRDIGRLRPDVVFNFYDGVGALALRKLAPGIRRIGIGHHFYLHLDNYRCKKGAAWHRWLLRQHTNLVKRSCDRVLALSYREVPGHEIMDVVPPLVRRQYREIQYRAGKRYLAYFLNEGLLYDLILLARELPDFQVDVFTSLVPRLELPEGFALHAFDAEKFRTYMASCRGLITSAGFDAAAEVAYHGIPLAVIPTRNHYEQQCNAADIERSGIGKAISHVGKEMLEQMKSSEADTYRAWVDSAPGHLLKWVEE
jgi:uncharacterized protein (TIGR00661 family)